MIKIIYFLNICNMTSSIYYSLVNLSVITQMLLHAVYLRCDKKREKLEALGNWNQLASVRHERDDAAAAAAAAGQRGAGARDSLTRYVPAGPYLCNLSAMTASALL